MRRLTHRATKAQAAKVVALINRQTGEKPEAVIVDERMALEVSDARHIISETFGLTPEGVWLEAINDSLIAIWSDKE